MAEINKPADLTKYIWGQTGQSVRPSNAKINLGWVAEIPPYQFENWVQNRSDTAIAHIVQHGIPVWDSSTEYLANRSVVLASNNKLYKATQTGTNVDPVTDGGANWITLFEDIKEAATTSKRGVVELATHAESRGRSSDSVVVTPGGLGSALDSHESATNVHSISAVTGLQAALNGLTNDIIEQVGSIEIDSFFTGSSQSLTNKGYQSFPGGLTLQWGDLSVLPETSVTSDFPTEFPNACFAIIGSKGASITLPGQSTCGFEPLSRFQFKASNTATIGDTGGSAQKHYWIAVGY